VDETILRVEGLRKSFGDFCAINGITLDIRPNMITSVIGPNGAGKTTLINLVTGSLRSDTGRVLFKGEDITYLPIHKMMKRRINRSFQIMNFFPRLSVFDNVELSLLPVFGRSLSWFLRSNSYQDIIKAVESVLEKVKLLDKKDLPAGQVSHGDQRLLELGIAIAPRPELCFLDEPSSGMGRSESFKVAELIKKLSAEDKITFVIIEHDMDVVFSLSDWIVVMNKGEVLTEGEPEQIKGNKEVQEIYLGKGG